MTKSHSDPAIRSGIRPADLLVEAAVGITVKPLRSGLTILGVAVGVAVLVATVGLAATTSRSVSERFDDLRAREVGLRATGITDLGDDLDQRLAALPGVEIGGVLGPATDRPRSVSALRFGLAIDAPIVMASPGGLGAARPTVTGRSFEGVASEQPTALVGGQVAEALGVRLRPTPTTIFIDDIPFTVIGIIEQSERRATLVGEIVVPVSTAVAIWPDPQANILIDVKPGAARQVAAQAPLVLRPDDPTSVEAQLMPEARQLRSDITAELDALGVAISGTVLAVAGLAVAATTMLSVLERRREIGLHRALGARPLHIGLRFLNEAIIIGLAGGVTGTSAGVIVVALVARSAGSTPALPAWTPPAAVMLGLTIALLAGAYPAYRAARLDPIEALRGS